MFHGFWWIWLVLLYYVVFIRWYDVDIFLIFLSQTTLRIQIFFSPFIVFLPPSHLSRPFSSSFIITELLINYKSNRSIRRDMDIWILLLISGSSATTLTWTFTTLISAPRKIIQKEMTELNVNPSLDCSIGQKGDNLYHWISVSVISKVDHGLLASLFLISKDPFAF